MKIAVIGTGYVGLVTGSCFADMGNDVVCVDINNEKVERLKKGMIPIYEPGLEELVKKNCAEGRLQFTTSLSDAVAASEVCFIAVGTPPGSDGSADVGAVLAVAEGIGRHMNGYRIIVTKSTVPVGTAARVRSAVAGALASRGVSYTFDVVSNPEFLKEGSAIEDFFRPDRIVIGVENGTARANMEALYAPFVRSGAPILFMGVPSAEMTKYAANALLATKISFMNEVANLCDKVGADVEEVRRGIGTDKRIGPHFLYAGIGYGGSCFPKDVQALAQTARANQCSAHIVDAVEAVNRKQKELLADTIISHHAGDVRGKTFGMWGLAFKPNTDDMREAPSLVIAERLLAAGANICAYDPQAVDEARRFLGDRIEYAKDAYDVLQDADGLILVTEWRAFREPDFARMKSLLRTPVIFDGRNQYDPDKMKSFGFTYYCIGRNV